MFIARMYDFFSHDLKKESIFLINLSKSPKNADREPNSQGGKSNNLKSMNCRTIGLITKYSLVYLVKFKVQGVHKEFFSVDQWDFYERYSKYLFYCKQLKKIRIIVLVQALPKHYFLKQMQFVFSNNNSLKSKKYICCKIQLDFMSINSSCQYP